MSQNTSGTQEAERFAALDADFVRVIEDVIDVLIVRNLIQITDFPPEVQAKLLARKDLRERLAQRSLPQVLDPHTGCGR